MVKIKPLFEEETKELPSEEVIKEEPKEETLTITKEIVKKGNKKIAPVSRDTKKDIIKKIKNADLYKTSSDFLRFFDTTSVKLAKFDEMEKELMDLKKSMGKIDNEQNDLKNIISKMSKFILISAESFREAIEPETKGASTWVSETEIKDFLELVKKLNLKK